MTTPHCVLFDLDGVLGGYVHAARLRLLAQRSGASTEEIDQALFRSGLERAADLGQYDPQGQIDALARALGRPITLQDCIDARRAAMSADSDVLALAGQVAQRASVAILTNNTLLLRDHLPEICPPLFPLFAGRVYCSAQYRMAKPEPAIFRACLRDLAVDPAQTLFVDDKAENADGARAAGLRAHHYTGLPQLRTELVRLGLLAD